MDNQVSVLRPNLERVPTRACPRLEGDEVLVSQLGKQILNRGHRVRRHAGDSHVAAGPACQIG
jgi:hypothetical protein